MTTNKEDIRRWLDLYMEGKTSLEEEALLTEYFRSPDADKDFADFKTMFDQFDEGEPSFTEEEQERWMQSCPLEEIPGSSALQDADTAARQQTMPHLADIQAEFQKQKRRMDEFSKQYEINIPPYENVY